MKIKTLNTIVGVYETHDGAIAALEALKAAGLPVKNMSFISKADVIESKLYAVSSNSVVNAPLEIGAVIGPILGILAGVSIMAIPGLGFIYGAGAITGAVVGFDFGLVGGGITTLLLTLGIKKSKISAYHKHLESGKFIVTISGDRALANKAKNILHTVGLHADLQHH